MRTLISHNIQEAKYHLLNNDVVAIPTETVYGLAANALSEEAVVKIFQVKNRPHFNPLIVHCGRWTDVPNYVEEIPEKFFPLIKAFSPGPITFLLKKKNTIPDLVTAGSDFVAIRIPNHPVTLELLQTLPFPVAAPSANEFGYISPTTAQHVMDSLTGKIPFILNGEKAMIGLESTIVGINENNQVVVHRLGGVSVEYIQNELGEEVLIATLNEQPLTSGQLKSHYAPKAPLYVGDVQKLLQEHNSKKVFIISFQKLYNDLPLYNQFILSEEGNINIAAQKLFSALRKIDTLNPDVILAEIFPEYGLGRAINDRLERAKTENRY
jgi:L-threonylcarbamoyladenylate synthase